LINLTTGEKRGCLTALFGAKIRKDRDSELFQLSGMMIK
jgi:hypothetical protein